MTTVVLTPTHIASDHCVINHTYPLERQVNIQSRKIFIHPKKKMLIGISGQALEEMIDTPETWEQLGDIASFVLNDVATIGQHYGETTINETACPLKHYVKVFDVVGQVLLVLKKYRFAITYSRELEHFRARRLGDYAGIGTGGSIAAGMLAGGMDINDIWEPLNRLDPMSSKEHTIVPLSSLKKMRHLDTTMKSIRDGVTTQSKEDKK